MTIYGLKCTGSGLELWKDTGSRLEVECKDLQAQNIIPEFREAEAPKLRIGIRP